MSFARIRAPGAWVLDSVIDPAELEELDSRWPSIIDGGAGGSWAPSSPIVIGGSGLNITGALDIDGVADFSANVSISGTLTVTNDSILQDISADDISAESLATTMGVDVGGALSVTGTSTFTGNVTNDGGLTQNGAASFYGTTSFHDNVSFFDLVNIKDELDFSSTGHLRFKFATAPDPAGGSKTLGIISGTGVDQQGDIFRIPNVTAAGSEYVISDLGASSGAWMILRFNTVGVTIPIKREDATTIVADADGMEFLFLVHDGTRWCCLLRIGNAVEIFA